MPRYIDANAIDLERVSDTICQWQAQEAIEDTPTADVVEVKHGMWIEYNYPGAECVYCSKCKEEYYPDDLLLGANDYPNFCPNCGARMDERRDDE